MNSMTPCRAMIDQYAKANFELCGYQFLDLEKLSTESLYSKEIQLQTAGNFIDIVPLWADEATSVIANADAEQLTMLLCKIRRAAGFLCIEPLQASLFGLERTSSRLYQDAYVALAFKTVYQIELLVGEVADYISSLQSGNSYGA